ncbi:hypothetical protein PoMZ_05927 [Pyricularia oryzae]|uniref:Uncharacterized protein n=1 Tax=Pyricularia oryzae TaxID=318829 RepID=A0A4P7NPD2_PYROR|nr:hypothetical protein PoMZ_05927 [Pyricularia oryzae]
MSESESPYPYPEGNGTDQKTFGIIMGVLCLAAVLAIAFTVWIYMCPKKASEVDPEAGPQRQPKGEEGGDGDEGSESGQGDGPTQAMRQPGPKHPRVPQSVHSGSFRSEKSNPKPLKQLPQQFSQLPPEVQQQILAHAEKPDDRKHRDKTPAPASRQLRMHLWDSLSPRDHEELYEKFDADIQRRAKLCLEEQRLEEQLAKVRSQSRNPQSSAAASSSHSSSRPGTAASSTYPSFRAPTTVATSVHPPSEATFVDVPGAYPSYQEPPRMYSRRRALSSVLTIDYS